MEVRGVGNQAAGFSGPMAAGTPLGLLGSFCDGACYDMAITPRSAAPGDRRSLHSAGYFRRAQWSGFRADRPGRSTAHYHHSRCPSCRSADDHGRSERNDHDLANHHHLANHYGRRDDDYHGANDHYDGSNNHHHCRSNHHYDGGPDHHHYRCAARASVSR
jgi:hypothetical protein